jgi:hypothetical protein
VAVIAGRRGANAMDRSAWTREPVVGSSAGRPAEKRLAAGPTIDHAIAQAVRGWRRGQAATQGATGDVLVRIAVERPAEAQLSRLVVESQSRLIARRSTAVPTCLAAPERREGMGA